MNLSKQELDIFRALVGERYNNGKRELRLVARRFPNKIENKRYLIYQLERLLEEARKISKAKDEEDKHNKDNLKSF